MAGMGTRMRPHTLSTPKPLLKIAGISIVERLATDITQLSESKIDEIAFIIGNFGKEVENTLLSIAQKLDAKGSIYYQNEALGTAHAIYCAEKSLKGKVIVAFADTLFKANFKLEEEADSVIWVKEVDKPEQFGVVKLDKAGIISDFIEKPKTFVSKLAIIGIYYFKNGENFRNELKYLLDNKITVNGEFQLTDALENMKNKKLVFKTGTVKQWMDCGNKNATVDTNKNVLINSAGKISKTLQNTNSVFIEPVYIGENVKITNSVIGPYVSIEPDTDIENSVIENSIIYTNSRIKNVNITNSMVGNYVSISGKPDELSIGDYSTI